MALLNYTTKVDVHRTISEIQQILAKAGANAIMHEYDDNGYITALSFRLTVNGQPMGYRLPTDWRPVQKTLDKQRVEPRYRSDEQALRVAWRITKDWVEAQLAIVETSMVTTDQVFLPYAVTQNGQTLYERFRENPSLLLGSGRDD